MGIGMWNYANSRRKRILTMAAVFIVAVLITIVGSLVPMSKKEAMQISNDLNQTVATMNAQGTLPQYIFGNNMLICLVMFVPIIGPVLGLSIMYNTGAVVGAIATSGGYHPFLALLALFITPVAWLEFISYSTALAESVWLFRRLLQGRGIRELKNMSIFVAMCAIILAVSAILEVAIISIGI